MEPDLDAAIIVPSIAVDDLVVRCIETCRELYPDVEIVVAVDEAGDDERRSAVDRLARLVVTGPLTIGAKRNLGASETRAGHLAFIDSDAYPEPGWLEGALTHLAADAGHSIGAIGGPNVSPSVEPLGERCVGRAHLSPLVSGWWTYRKRRTARARDVEHLPTCNLIVRRSSFDEVGGMDPHLFTAEDTDFCRRLRSVGHRIRFEPDVVVTHKNRNMVDFLIQRFTFGVAMVPLLRWGEAPSKAYTASALLPVAMLVHLAAGPAVTRSTRLRRPWWAISGLYFSVVAAETIRVARRLRDVPATALAILIGNLGPGAGLVARAAGGFTDLRGIYRNDRGAAGSSQR